MKKWVEILEVELVGLSLLIAKPYHLTKPVSFEFKSRCHWINQFEEERALVISPKSPRAELGFFVWGGGDNFCYQYISLESR